MINEKNNTKGRPVDERKKLIMELFRYSNSQYHKEIKSGKLIYDFLNQFSVEHIRKILDSIKYDRECLAAAGELRSNDEEENIAQHTSSYCPENKTIRLVDDIFLTIPANRTPEELIKDRLKIENDYMQEVAQKLKEQNYSPRIANSEEDELLKLDLQYKRLYKKYNNPKCNNKDKIYKKMEDKYFEIANTDIFRDGGFVSKIFHSPEYRIFEAKYHNLPKSNEDCNEIYLDAASSENFLCLLDESKKYIYKLVNSNDIDADQETAFALIWGKLIDKLAVKLSTNEETLVVSEEDYQFLKEQPEIKIFEMMAKVRAREHVLSKLFEYFKGECYKVVNP
jgi:hypothetical protein